MDAVSLFSACRQLPMGPAIFRSVMWCRFRLREAMAWLIDAANHLPLPLPLASWLLARRMQICLSWQRDHSRLRELAAAMTDQPADRP